VELRGPADVPQPTFALLDRLEAESVAIEAPRAVEVLRGELGHGARRAQWTPHGGDLFRLGFWLWTVGRRKLIVAIIRTREGASTANL